MSAELWPHGLPVASPRTSRHHHPEGERDPADAVEAGSKPLPPPPRFSRVRGEVSAAAVLRGNDDAGLQRVSELRQQVAADNSP